ncbi:DNA polymerase delta subunit 3-like [Atheta coriaria]|uniref:DNA polymerase delta subunit 3-like n=1 Tax=Dalotia coriaria TaxID=877792 RepID=UPI0031F4433D
MDSESEELYLMKLKQYVYDEDKIVTAVSLSVKHNIDIHTSHTLLKQFVEDQQAAKNDKNLGISYTLMGTLKDSGTKTFMIVKHDQLAEKKKLFKNLQDELVYSVQKTADVNFDLVAMVDMWKLPSDKGSLSGCTISKNCILRKNLPNRKVLPTVTRAAGTDKSKASHLFASKSKETAKTSTSDVINKEEIKKEPKETKTENKTNKLTKQNSGEKKNTAIANMFAKAPPPKEKPEQIKQEVKDEPVEAMSIDDDDSNDEEIDLKKKETSKNSSKKTIKKKEELYDSGTDEEAQKIEAANKAKAKTSPKKKAAANKNKRQRDKSVEKPQKKRKRIVQHVESDEDIFADDDEDTEPNDSNIIVSDDDAEIKTTQTKKLAPKNRKRKYVDKTTMDEDGYMGNIHIIYILI